MAVTLIGNYLSPYVRKVLVCLDMKGIEYEIDPIIPFYGSDDFTRLNPDRRIPVLLHDDLVLTESSVICEYLDEIHPRPSLLPEDPRCRARARALQAFADGRIGNILIWQLFNEQVIKRFVWEQPADQALLERTLGEDIPLLLDYLEGVLPADGFLFGSFGLADIAVVTMFRNAGFVRFAVDAGRWPVTAGFVERGLEHPSFDKLRPFENTMLHTPIPRHREALREAGAPISEQTWGTATPRLNSQRHRRATDKESR